LNELGNGKTVPQQFHCADDFYCDLLMALPLMRNRLRLIPVHAWQSHWLLAVVLLAMVVTRIEAQTASVPPASVTVNTAASPKITQPPPQKQGARQVTVSNFCK
jgi:hypothetical protein